MLTRKAKLFLSLTAAVPLLFAACTDSSIFGPYGDVAGTYALTVFDGRSVPTTITYQPGDFPELFPSGGTIRWTDGTMALSRSGTFVETDNAIVTPNGEASQNASFVSNGTYTVNGTDFTLSAPAQNGRDTRFASGTLEFETINYSEDNGNGTTSAFEYKLR